MKKKNEKEQEKDSSKQTPLENADETIKQPEDTAKEAAGEADQKAAEPEKKLSETDILKIYLEQALGELKRVKSENEELKKKEQEQEAKLTQLSESFKTQGSEYENYRRRTAEEKEAILSDAVAKSVSALLPALDSLEKAVLYAQSNPESLKDGVTMTVKQLKDAFASLGVEEIEADGTPFDPQLHNAVMHVEDDSLTESVVTEVFQKGYKIGDRVIRHSMVKVAN